MSKANNQRTMKDYLSTVGQFNVTVHRSAKPEPKPKSLLTRIREKEAAMKEVEKQRDPKREKRCNILHALKRSMVEVIFSLFNLRKVRGMDLNTLRSLVAHSCGEMSRVAFMEHVDLLCELCPEICAKKAYLGKTCLKLSGVECVDEVLQRIDDELVRLGR